VKRPGIPENQRFECAGEEVLQSLFIEGKEEGEGPSRAKMKLSPSCTDVARQRSRRTRQSDANDGSQDEVELRELKGGRS
jgi:hypothetical protein